MASKKDIAKSGSVYDTTTEVFSHMTLVALQYMWSSMSEDGKLIMRYEDFTQYIGSATLTVMTRIVQKKSLSFFSDEELEDTYRKAKERFYQKQEKPVPKSEPASEDEAEDEPVEKIAKKMPESTNKITCSFILVRGVNKGNKCGKPVKSDTEYCAVHGEKPEKKASDSERVSEEDLENDVSEKKIEKKVTEKKTCDYVCTRGANVGEVCGKSIAKDHDSKCCVHKKSPTTQKTPKKAAVPVQKHATQNPGQIHLNRSTTGILYHKDTGFVFSNVTGENRVVIGKVVIENGKMVGEVNDLSPEDIRAVEEFDQCGVKFTVADKYKKMPISCHVSAFPAPSQSAIAPSRPSATGPVNPNRVVPPTISSPVPPPFKKTSLVTTKPKESAAAIKRAIDDVESGEEESGEEEEGSDTNFFDSDVEEESGEE